MYYTCTVQSITPPPNHTLLPSHIIKNNDIYTPLPSRPINSHVDMPLLPQAPERWLSPYPLSLLLPLPPFLPLPLPPPLPPLPLIHGTLAQVQLQPLQLLMHHSFARVSKEPEKRGEGQTDALTVLQVAGEGGAGIRARHIHHCPHHTTEREKATRE